MRDGSYVEMKSDTIEMMCDEALENIDDERKKKRISYTRNNRIKKFWVSLTGWL
jgi:hypothetical protein